MNKHLTIKSRLMILMAVYLLQAAVPGAQAPLRGPAGGLSDISVSLVCLGRSYFKGDDITNFVKVVLKNNGVDSSQGFSLEVALSVDQSIDIPSPLLPGSPDDDILLRCEQVIPLPPGSTLNYAFQGPVILPEDIVGGTYYLGVVADRGNKLGESNFFNNTARTSRKILERITKVSFMPDSDPGPGACGPICLLVYAINFPYGSGVKVRISNADALISGGNTGMCISKFPLAQVYAAQVHPVSIMKGTETISNIFN